MVRPADDGSSACALTIVTTHAYRPLLTVVEIPPDEMTTTVTTNHHGGNTYEPPRNNSRNNGQDNHNYGSSPNAGSHASLQLGQDARNAGNTPRSLTVYQPINGTPPAPVSVAGTRGIRHGAMIRTMQTINSPKARQPELTAQWW